MSESPRNLSSTYFVQFVQENQNQEEVTRLEIQDKMLTAGMGGVLPELADPSHLRWVLDVGCGTGCWLIETAKTYPTIEKLVGVDVNNTMVEYARTKAKQQVLERVEFQVMDALNILEFTPGTFDLINHRLGISWLRNWEWTNIMRKYLHICKYGGIIRITEPNVMVMVENTTSAVTKLHEICLEAFYNSGRLFFKATDGLTGKLPHLLAQHGLQNVQARVHNLVYRAGTPEGQQFYEDMKSFFRVLLPFFQKWMNVPSNYEELYRQALLEMQQPNFTVTWQLVTAWGTKG